MDENKLRRTSMGREFELKYRADAPTLAAIRAKFGEFTTIAMETAYFDNPQGDLRRRHWTLRRRLENGRSVCALKTPLPDGSRGEWETECGSITDAISELCKLGAPAELEAMARQGLTQSCAARFTRLAAVVELQAATVELALDQGLLLGGGQALPFAEVEVELKAGSDDAAIAFASALAREFRLAREPKSKIQRALALANAARQ